MKSLGYVLGEFPVMSETFVGCEMRAMIKQGYQVQPLAFHSEPKNGQPVDAPLVEKLKLIGQVSSLQAAKIWLKNPKRSLQALKFINAQSGLPKRSLALACGQLAVLVNQHGLEHLHAHFALHTAATAIACSKLTGCKVSFVGHGYDVYSAAQDLPLKLQHSHFAVAVCSQMQQEFQQQTLQQVHLVHCGIELSRYQFSGRENHNGKLLFIGRLVEKKGLLDLLTALAAMPEGFRPALDLVGTGPQQAELERCCTLLKLTNVNFLGARNSQWIIDNAADYMALCAPFCLAKNGDRDTGPVVVKEAMALGLPVITTRFMGCQDMLTESSGFLVQPNAPHQLADAIEAVIRQHPSRRMAMMQLARLRLEQLYSSDKSAEQLALAIEGAA